MGIRFMGMYLIGVHLMGMCLHGRLPCRRHLMGAYLTGRASHRRVPHRRASHRRVPYRRASHGCVPHGRVLHRRDYWPAPRELPPKLIPETGKQNTRCIRYISRLPGSSRGFKTLSEIDVLNAVTQVMLVQLRRHDGVIWTTTLITETSNRVLWQIRPRSW
jgi:hypothetical protein